MSPVLHLSLLSAGAAVAAAALAGVIAWLLATTRGVPLDQPGPRSSHSRPTPRGGGLGIVVVGLLAVPALAWTGAWPVRPAWFVMALALVAAIGFLDDWSPRPALLRLLVHLLAAALLAWVMLEGALGLRWPLWQCLLALLALAWSINLHNFMDGSNGLLGWQAVWYGATLSGLLFWGGEYAMAAFAMLLGAASTGFLFMNWPRARVFMGDGGSGFIGLAFAGVALFGVVQKLFGLPECLIIASAFLVDATATLLLRMLRGQRFWHGHREHLYQHLLRAGRSHLSVSLLYLGWNLLVALPALLVSRQLEGDALHALPAAAVLLLALCAWFVGRLWCAPRMARLEGTA